MTLTLEPNSINEVVSQLGPCLSSTLAERLSELYGITPFAARKRIERAKRRGEIRALEGIRFQHNEQLLFLESQQYDKDFVRRLMDFLARSNSRYRLPLLGCLARGGAVPSWLFATFSAFPMSVKRGSEKQTADSTLAKLLQSGLLSREERIIRVHSSILPQSVSFSRIKARCSAETLVLAALSDFLMLQGLTTRSRCKIRSSEDPPQFGFYAWDLVGPSFIQPIAVAATPGFVVADVLLGRTLSLPDTAYFVQKCSDVRAFKNTRPFLAMLIGSWFEKEALAHGRSHGLLFTTPKNLFGADFAKLLDALAQALEMKPEFIAAKPNYLMESLDHLKHISHWQTAFLSTRHALFLLVVLSLLSVEFRAQLHLPIELNDHTLYDFVLQNEQQTIFVICKDAPGYALTSEDLQEWLTKIRNITKEFGTRAHIAICTSAKLVAPSPEILTIPNVHLFDFDKLNHMISATYPLLLKQFQATFRRELEFPAELVPSTEFDTI